jgi:hypothetical protein
LRIGKLVRYIITTKDLHAVALYSSRRRSPARRERGCARSQMAPQP